MIINNQNNQNMYRRLQIISLSLPLSLFAYPHALSFIPWTHVFFSLVYLIPVPISLSSFFVTEQLQSSYQFFFLDRCGSPRSNFSSTLNIFYLILSTLSFVRIRSNSLFLLFAQYPLSLFLSFSLSRFLVCIFLKLVSLDST